MTAASTGSPSESAFTAPLDQTRPSTQYDSTASASDRFREELTSIFGIPKHSETFKVAGDNRLAPKETGDKSSPAVTDKTFDDFAKKNGLESRKTPDGKVEFSLQANGEKVVIGTVDKTTDGFKEIEKALEERTDEKKQDIEQRFGVKFAPPGEKGLKQMSFDGSQKPGAKDLEIREPKYKELLGIEAALEHANPAHVSGTDKPLTFYFLKDKTFSPGSGGAAAYHPDIKGGPAVIVDPGSTDYVPVTERDRKEKLGAHNSIESLMLHELSHNTEISTLADPKVKAEIYKKMGWTTIPGLPQEDGTWMLKGKDGRGYVPPQGGMGPWERIDRKGRVTAQVDPSRVHRLAQEKPATDYFEGPHEMLAEGLTMLRLGGDHRTELFNRNSKLHDVMKDVDQREIDQAYGKGKFIRSYDGRLVPRTDESLLELRKREEAARTRH